jgi:hypothetical protein
MLLHCRNQCSPMFYSAIIARKLRTTRQLNIPKLLAQSLQLLIVIRRDKQPPLSFRLKGTKLGCPNSHLAPSLPKFIRALATFQ